MAELKFCPTCGIKWPNFCPLDGQKLSGAWTCSNAPKPEFPVAAPAAPPVSPTPPAAPPRAEPAPPRAEPAPKPAASTAPSPRPAVKKATTRARRKVDPDLLRTVIDQASARPPGPEPGRKGRGADPQEPKQKDTVVKAPARPDAPLASGAGAQRAAPAEASDPGARDSAKKGGRRGFSETQWFLKGLEIDKAKVDPSTGVVAIDEEEYLRDESIPEEERRKFTLRKPGEE